MKATRTAHDELPAKIMAALTLLDQKGVNEDVTRAMTIVFEAFRRHAAKRSFTAGGLVRFAKRQ